jgi:excisionase family DNA binding protein
MKTYTTQEAAAATGLSIRALRKRIERGQLRAVQHGRYWRLPHAELERAGLVPSEGTQLPEGTEGTSDGLASLLAELEATRAENVRLTQELVRLRPLPARVDAVTEDLLRERAELKVAEARAAAEMSAAAEAREWRSRLTSAGWRERRRLLRAARSQQAA